MWTRYWKQRKRFDGDGARAAARACRRGVFALVALLVLSSAAFAPAAAAAKSDVAVDLELVLAIDVSGSIDPDEARLQRNGYVAAFNDPEVIHSITNGMIGRVAVTYVEWAGATFTHTVIGWTLIDSEASAHAFAARLAKEPIETELWTSISHAIDFAVPLFKDNGYSGIRRVIDISGDGANNQGGLVTIHRDRAIAAGITINGLPIVNHRAGPWGWPQLEDLDLYYAACVIGGRGAFYVVANAFPDFARAVRQKLLLEVAGRTPGDGPERIFKAAANAPQRKTPPCDAGESRMHWLLDK